MLLIAYINSRGSVGTGQPKDEAPGSLESNDNDNKPLLARTLPGMLPAGIELGALNFIGTALSVQGLALTSPTRAGEWVVLACYAHAQRKL